MSDACRQIRNFCRIVHSLFVQHAFMRVLFFRRSTKTTHFKMYFFRSFNTFSIVLILSLSFHHFRSNTKHVSEISIQYQCIHFFSSFATQISHVNEWVWACSCLCANWSKPYSEQKNEYHGYMCAVCLCV